MSRSIFIQVMLLITAASTVIYSYGLLSDYTAISFLVISSSILFLSVVTIRSNLQNSGQLMDASEQRHHFSGHEFRSYKDRSGVLWLRESDIRKSLRWKRPITVLLRIYGKYFRKANPALDVWYIHPKALRAMAGKNIKEADDVIVKWLEKEVIGVHYGLISIGGKQKPSDEVEPQKTQNWFIRVWHGEAGLLASIILGGLIVYLLGFVFSLLYPEDFLLHYRLYAFNYLVSITVTTITLFWWGHGIVMATQRWIALGRSLWFALISVSLGGYVMATNLNRIVTTEHQYGFVEWLSILSDTDPKPYVGYYENSRTLIVYGGLHFGTTNSVRSALAYFPETKIIGLRSYGGRMYEGFGLYELIREKNLDTYAWAECMSACVIAYVGGANRYVTDTAFFGLHRGGLHWDKKDEGPTDDDYYVAYLMQNAGVDESLIRRGLVPSIHGIYLPTVEVVVDAHLATEKPIKSLF